MRRPETASTSGVEPSLKGSGVRQARPWVLVYEPDQAVRCDLVELFEDVGLAVWECTDPAQGIAAAKSLPRLAGVVVNLRDGAELADAVRRVQPGVRVLCLSDPGVEERPLSALELLGRLLVNGGIAPSGQPVTESATVRVAATGAGRRVPRGGAR